MPDRVTPPAVRARDVRRRRRRRGGCERLGGRAAASRPRLVRGCGRGPGARRPCRSRSSVRATRCASPTSSTRCSPTSRPTNRSRRSRERWAAWRSPAAAAPTGSRAWACCPCAIGSPRGTRPEEFPDSLVDMAGSGRRDDSVGTDDQRRGAMRAGAGRAPRRRGSSGAASVVGRGTRTRGHDDRHGSEPGRDDRTTERRRRSRSPGDLRDPAGRVGGAVDRHVPLRARGRRDRSHRRSIRSSCWTAR